MFLRAFAHACVIVALAMLCNSAQAATITVTTNADSGPGSLRDAINQAVANDGEDTIVFDLLPSEIIMPLSELPALDPQSDEDRTIIRGPQLISGEMLGGTEVGFRLITDNDVLENLTIYSFPSHGVYIEGNNNRVSGCFIGNDGKGPKPNGGDGIYIESGVGNVIGFDGEDATGNIISGNSGAGIQTRFDPEGTVILGNLIGIKFSGEEAMSNGSSGILLACDNAVVGDGSVEGRNVLSGNTGHGILMQSAVTGTQIAGNYIGTNAAGDESIPNSLAGVTTLGVANEIIIGGTDEGDGNVISGNNLDGIVLRGTNHEILGNLIGTTANAVGTLPNTGSGIDLQGTTNVRIGDLTPGLGNVIANNGEHGVLVQSTASEATIRGNSIHSNNLDGISVDSGGNADIAAPNITALGSVIGTAPANATVDIYTDLAGEGRIYIDTVTADGNGDFTSQADVSTQTEFNVTATATDTNGNTSEFSSAFPIGTAEGEGEEEGEGEGTDPGNHTADQNNDSEISLSELLRVIQFFNSDGFSCALPPESTEDGYTPGPGNQTCATHASDYNPQDWEISLSELLRVIQFFNIGGYTACPEEDPPTEDGFCAGGE